MIVSAELFDQTSRSFVSGSAHMPEQLDMRSDVRVGLVGRAVIIPCPARCKRQPATVALRDVSAAGLQVIYTQRLESGEQFILCMPPAAGGAPPEGVVCTVVHCQPVALGIYAIGARFAQKLGLASADNSSGRSARGGPAMNVDGLAEAFRDHAVAGLNPEEHEQLRQLEARLGRLQAQ
jgi:hypothetical protein